MHFLRDSCVIWKRGKVFLKSADLSSFSSAFGGCTSCLFVLMKDKIQGQPSSISAVSSDGLQHTLTKQITTCSQKFNQQQLAQPARALIKIRYKGPCFFFSLQSKIGPESWSLGLQRQSVGRGQWFRFHPGEPESERDRGGGRGDRESLCIPVVFIYPFFKSWLRSPPLFLNVWLIQCFQERGKRKKKLQR